MTAFATSIDALVALDNEQFVRTAYELLLGRSADQAGLAYYIARLDSGYSRLSVLLQLRRSEEWRSDHGVGGLNRMLRHYRMARLPLVGWLFAGLWKVERETVSQRLQRQVVGRLAALQEELRTGGLPAASGSRSTQRSGVSHPAASTQRRNMVAEQLSPRAREIFDRLTST